MPCLALGGAMIVWDDQRPTYPDENVVERYRRAWYVLRQLSNGALSSDVAVDESWRNHFRLQGCQYTRAFSHDSK
jgi:hypothetical protein